jgi:hypothetical protein
MYSFSNAQVGDIQPRLEIRDLAERLLQYSLFVQAMNRLTNIPLNDPSRRNPNSCSVAKVQFSSVQEVNSPNQNQNQVYKVRTRTEPN